MDSFKKRYLTNQNTGIPDISFRRLITKKSEMLEMLGYTKESLGAPAQQLAALTATEAELTQKKAAEERAQKEKTKLEKEKPALLKERDEKITALITGAQSLPITLNWEGNFFEKAKAA